VPSPVDWPLPGFAATATVTATAASSETRPAAKMIRRKLLTSPESTKAVRLHGKSRNVYRAEN
jgi:hypothetical protein